MGTPFSDITLYAPTPHTVGSNQYIEETALKNYICDLYGICMHGYKPPNTTRVSIQPSFYNIWAKTWRDGSLISVAAYFNYDEYSKLSTKDKYKYILEIVHGTMLKLSLEYKWDKRVFEKAYHEILENDFTFKIDYPKKQSRDKQKHANIVLTKTEMTTTISILLENSGEISLIKLFDKKNWWWYDSTYKLAKYSKWFDNDRFGLFYKPKNWGVWHSIKDNKIVFEKEGILSDRNNVGDVFTF